MSKDKFFFEEDPQAGEDSGLTWGEHAEAFMGALKEDGLAQSGLSLEPMDAQSDMDMTTVKNSLIELQYGTVGDDYVIHITPTHPQKNLKLKPLLDEAMKTTITILAAYVPVSLRVDIHPPQKDWEIKATSYLIRGGATAWNLDRAELESKALPEMIDKVGQICMKA